MQLIGATSAGMGFEASITAPTIPGITPNIGDGTVFFLQTVVTQRERSDPGYPNQEMSSGNATVLDGPIPYGSGEDFPSSFTHEWRIDAGETLSSAQ